jgi:hypothetical protein
MVNLFQTEIDEDHNYEQEIANGWGTENECNVFLGNVTLKFDIKDYNNFEAIYEDMDDVYENVYAYDTDERLEFYSKQITEINFVKESEGLKDTVDECEIFKISAIDISSDVNDFTYNDETFTIIYDATLSILCHNKEVYDKFRNSMSLQTS